MTDKLQCGSVIFRNEGHFDMPAIVIGDGTTAMGIVTHKEMKIAGIGFSFDNPSKNQNVGSDQLLMFSEDSAIDTVIELLLQAKEALKDVKNISQD